MSFSYKGLEISGYSEGITGTYTSEGLRFITSGLAYDGTGFTINHFRKVTGIAIIGSGLVKEVSGSFNWDSDNNVWYADVPVSGSDGEQGTGAVEWYYNDVVSDNTGFLLTGIAIFTNPNEIAWNTITNTNGSVSSADTQHSHPGSASQLEDLNDVARTGAFVYTQGYILQANGYDSYESVLGPIGIDPTGYETVSGGYIAHILDSTAHHDSSGYEAISGDYLITSGDYVLLSGDFADAIFIDPTGYETVSGGYIAHVVDSTAHHDPSGYETVSGDWIVASGDLEDYKYVSGRYALTSGSYNSHITDSTAHLDPTGYETVSGGYIAHVISSTAHHDPSGYETVSGDYISHIVDTNAHIVDIIDITRANFSGLTDMSITESVLIKSIDDSGTSWSDGTQQGQFFWDTESNYRWDVNAGAWIEIGAATYGFPALSGLTDVDLPDSIDDGDALIYSTESGAWTTGFGGVADHTHTGYETISGDWIIASGDLEDYKYVSGRYALTSGSYNTHITNATAHLDPTGYESISGDYLITSGTIDDYKAVSGDYATTSGTVYDYIALSGNFSTHIGTSTAHINPTGYETVSGSYINHIADATAHIDPSGYETVSGDYWVTSGTIDDYKVISGVATGALGLANHLHDDLDDLTSDFNDLSGLFTGVSGDFVTHEGDANAHIVDIIQITRANFSGLTDMSLIESVLIKSIDDSGTAWSDGTQQGQFFWDTESNYRWDVNAGAWIEVGASNFNFPTLSGLTDTDLPTTITDGMGLVYSDESGAWTTGLIGAGIISDAVFGGGWSAVTETGASKASLYAVINPISGEWHDASGDLEDYKYVSGRYTLTSGSYNSHLTNNNAHIDNITDITTRNHNDLNTISVDDHHSITGILTVSGDFKTHISNTNAHIDNLTDITTRQHAGLTNVNVDDHHSITGILAVSGDYIITSGTIDDYTYVSGRYANTSGNYNSHLTNDDAHHTEAHALNTHTQGSDKMFYTKSAVFTEITLGAAGTYLKSAGAGNDLTWDSPGGGVDATGYEQVSGDYIVTATGYASHITDANAHIVDIIDITRANFSGLTDMGLTESVLIKSIDDSGTVWSDGTQQGQFFWDTESNYRWDDNAGAWIEIGTAVAELPSMSGLVDVNLPATIDDGNSLVYESTSGGWTTGEGGGGFPNPAEEDLHMGGYNIFNVGNITGASGAYISVRNSTNADWMHFYHNGTNGYIATAGAGGGDLYLEPAGNIRSSKKIYNSVYNDYADYWEANKGVQVQPGYCYSLEGKGLKVTDKRADKTCIGICSDTYGHAVGDIENGIPISIGGFILAHVDKGYKSGTLLVSNNEGKLTKGRFYERKIAMYMYKETKMKTKGIYVKGRHWVKIL